MGAFGIGRKLGGISDPTSLLNYGLSDVQEHPLGTIIDGEQGDQYIYCKFTSDIDASAAGIPVQVALGTFIATASGNGGPAFGILNKGVDTENTDAKYAWVQIGGHFTLCNVDGNAADGSLISWVADASGDLAVMAAQADKGAAAIQSVRGFFDAADNAGVGSGYLFPLF